MIVANTAVLTAPLWVSAWEPTWPGYGKGLFRPPGKLLYMVATSTGLSYVFGLPLGVILVTTEKVTS